MAKNKVKFGLKNVHVWPITEATSEKITYAEVIKVPGAVSLSLEASGDSNPFYADDMIYWNQYSNNGYEGELEIALIPEEFEVQILGYLKDKNGAIVESNASKSKNYAMAFEFDGDVTQTRHIFYNCSSSRPDIEGATTEDKTEPQTDTISITTAPASDTGYVKARLEKGQTGYDTFFTTPYKVTPETGAQA
ncbi:major tail protein [Peptoniphilus harei]|uniref:major tail protein n=1 Tax=Peptoniphilus harei TaxID=54005 RepID=UPI0011DDC47F|nr:major tail protein [Peptoniphilus harei]MDU5183679.1 phage tail protein [Peptoniphilus harei]